jgi:hypothetical protein
MNRRINQKFQRNPFKPNIVGERFDFEKFEAIIEERWEPIKHPDYAKKCKEHNVFIKFYGPKTLDAEPCWKCYDECIVKL